MQTRYLQALIIVITFTLSVTFAYAGVSEVVPVRGPALAMMEGGMMHQGEGMNDGYRNSPGDSSGQYYQTPDNSRRNRARNTDIKNMRHRIQEKRADLEKLYRADKPDRQLMNQKISELNNLEHQLDAMLTDSP